MTPLRLYIAENIIVMNICPLKMLGRLTFLFILLHVASLTFASRIIFEADVDLNNFLHCIKENPITDKEPLLTLSEDCKTGFDKLAAPWENEKEKPSDIIPRNFVCW